MISARSINGLGRLGVMLRPALTPTMDETASPVAASVAELVISPAAVSLAPRQAQQFVATIDGEPVAVGVTWLTGSTTASNGVMDRNGLYTAPQAGGRYVISARYGAQQAKAVVTVAVPVSAASWLAAQSVTTLYASWQELRRLIHASDDVATHGMDELVVGSDANGQVVVNKALIERELQARGAPGPVQKMEADQQVTLKKIDTAKLIDIWKSMKTGKAIDFNATTGMSIDLVDFELRARGVGPLTIDAIGVIHGPGIAEAIPAAGAPGAPGASGSQNATAAQDAAVAAIANLAKVSNAVLYTTWVAFKKGAPDPDPKTQLTRKIVESEFARRKIDLNALVAAEKKPAASSSKLPLVLGGLAVLAVGAAVILKRKSNL